MAAALIGGAAVGAAFGELLKAVLEIKDKANTFKHTLIYLQSTLVAIAPVVKEIEGYNNDLGRPKEELESLIKEMEEGRKLVCKCSKIHRLNYVARVRYQEQLVALVDSLVKFFIIDMQAQTARDQKETLLKVRRILSAVNKFPLLNTLDTSASSSDSAPMPLDVSESEIHDSSAAQPDENATTETSSVKEAMEHINQESENSSSDSETVPLDVGGLKSTATQPAEDAAGTNSMDQEMEPITTTKQESSQHKANAENNQGMEHLVSETSNDQLHTAEKRFIGIRLPKIVGFNRQVKKETFIEQNNKFNTEPDDKASSSKRTGLTRLVFLDSSYSFDLEDLLRGSAEVLGKGTYGTTYKTTLEDGSGTLAVKRLREVKLSITEFEQHVEILQTSLPEHPNVCSLRAYYYCSDEKLLIYDYVTKGSLSNLMHGRGKKGWTPLDWKSRIKIALGVARGVAHIHSASGMDFVHGNIKSSNVLVTADHQGCISDFFLTTLTSLSVIPPGNKVYQAPELIGTEKPTQKSDVYSFGILLLEILTGKSPGEDPYIASWVEAEFRDGVSALVYDAEIYKDMGNMCRHMMKLARACASWVPDRRPSMDEIVRKMEDIIASK